MGVKDKILNSMIVSFAQSCAQKLKANREEGAWFNSVYLDKKELEEFLNETG